MAPRAAEPMFGMANDSMRRKTVATTAEEDIPRPIGGSPRSLGDESSTTYSSSNLVFDMTSRDEFFDTGFVDFSYEIGFIVRIWNIIIGCAAILDFLAATQDSHVRKYWQIDTGRFDEWLRENSFELGMIFSILWFVDSFITAMQIRNEAYREADKARLLREEGWQAKVNNLQWKSTVTFILQIVVQLLLLPVGFYIWLSPGNEFTLTVHHYTDGGAEYDETERLTRHANISLIYAIFHHATSVFTEGLRQRALDHGKRSAFRWVRRNIRHPVKFARLISSK